MDRKTHNQIAVGLRTGDRQSWQQMYDLYAESIWRHTARLVSDRAAVEDVVQETFLAAARSATSYDPRRGSVWVWLWTIARRQVALHYRRQKPTVSLDQARHWWTRLNGQQNDIVADLQAPPELLASDELGALVRSCLAGLSAEYETLLLAKYVDQLPVKEISEQLQCSTVAVQSKLARARKTFKREFVKLTQTESPLKEGQS